MSKAVTISTRLEGSHAIVTHNCWDERRSNLQAPRNYRHLVYYQVGTVAQEDTERSPHLPDCVSAHVSAALGEKYSYQLMTNAPRIWAGEFSAAKMGTVEPFKPMPMPLLEVSPPLSDHHGQTYIRMRVMRSCSQV